MQRNFYTDDFEQLIRQKADQYKMYPSDQVWKGIYRSIHGRNRWRWAGLAVLLLGIGLYTGNWYLADKPANRIASNIESSITAANSLFIQSPVLAAPSHWIFPNTKQTGNNNNNNIPAQAQLQTGIAAISTRSNELQSLNNTVTDNTVTGYSLENSLVITNEIAQGVPPNKTSLQAGTGTQAEKALTSFADAASESVLQENKKQNINWLEEYAVFQLTASKPKRIGVQLHFSPTVNYRKLSGSSYYPTSESKSIPLAPNIIGDVDQYVKHSPALGFEVGTDLLYRSSKRLTLKAGVQFNYSRYEIKAYSSPMPEIATIALNNQTFIADTISTYSRIRNLSGYEAEDLSNQYFQLSLPIGVEYRVLGSGKLQLNIAGTIQPTYLLNRNTYLITTDYKNYMREPSLVRRWNVNGGLETYVSYYTGSVRWQVGPQFRYQLLSTYSRKYPIKEHLMEYGFKVGVSKTIR